MPRVVGVDIPNDKLTVIALRYIYGIGPKLAQEICRKTGVDPHLRAKQLTEEELSKIASVLESDYIIEGTLRRQTQQNIARLRNIACYRGLRHRRNLPTRELRQELASDFRTAPFEALTLAGKSPAEAQADAGRMQCDYVLYSEIAEIKTSKPGKVGGMLKKVSGDGPSRDVHEVRLDYKLYRLGAAAAPSFADTTKASSGGNFNVKSALHLAMFAGSLYLRFTGLGLLNPMLMSGAGGGLGPLAGSGLFDPRMSAMSSITQLATSGALAGNGDSQAPGADDSEAVIRQTVGAALANTAKGAVEHLQKSKK